MMICTNIHYYYILWLVVQFQFIGFSARKLVKHKSVKFASIDRTGVHFVVEILLRRLPSMKEGRE